MTQWVVFVSKVWGTKFRFSKSIWEPGMVAQAYKRRKWRDEKQKWGDPWKLAGLLLQPLGKATHPVSNKEKHKATEKWHLMSTPIHRYKHVCLLWRCSVSGIYRGIGPLPSAFTAVSRGRIQGDGSICSWSSSVSVGTCWYQLTLPQSDACHHSEQDTHTHTPRPTCNRTWAKSPVVQMTCTNPNPWEPVPLRLLNIFSFGFCFVSIWLVGLWWHLPTLFMLLWNLWSCLQLQASGITGPHIVQGPWFLR